MFRRPRVFSWPPARRRRTAHSIHSRLAVPALEDRSVPAALSIGGATAVEGGNALKLLDQFVAAGSGGLTKANISVFGADGNLYVADEAANTIQRYDGVTGAFRDTFVTAGSGGLQFPASPVFGPDGNLYVSSFKTGQVLRYDGSSGAFLGAVASGLSQPLGLTIGPDGSLYIAEQGANDVLRSNGSGLSVFVTAGSGGLSQPRNVAFRPDGDMYVASEGTGQVLRYSAATGAFIDVFATMPPTETGLSPDWLQFGTDGYLYTTAEDMPGSVGHSIVRFNATTGAFVDRLPLGRDGWSFQFGADGLVYESGNSAGGFVDRFGPSSLAVFTVSLDSPAASLVTVQYATADGTAIAGRNYVATSGTVTFAPGQTSQTILVQTLDDGIVDPIETFTVNLSSPSGAMIADGQGVGTIADGDTPRVTAVGENNGAAQRSMVTSLQVTFNTNNVPVSFLNGDVAGAFQLTRINGGTVGGFTASASVVNGATVVTLSGFTGAETSFGSLADGRYTLTALSSHISVNGAAMASDFTFADSGTTTGNQLYRLFGDANGDRVVNGADVTPFIQAFGGPSPMFDSNNDGVVNGADLGAFINNFGRSM